MEMVEGRRVLTSSNLKTLGLRICKAVGGSRQPAQQAFRKMHFGKTHHYASVSRMFNFSNLSKRTRTFDLSLDPM